MSPNLRILISSVAVALVALSITPLRRRVPLLRRVPAGIEFALWLGLAGLCLAALARVQTPRSTDLALAALRAGLDLATQSLVAVLEPGMRWVSAHQPGLALIVVAVVALAWAGTAARFAGAVGRARQPQPRLGDWWVVRSRRSRAPRRRPLPVPPAVQRRVVDAGDAAAYMGVSRATLYRWVRAGRLPCTREGSKLRFDTQDLDSIQRTPVGGTEASARGVAG